MQPRSGCLIDHRYKRRFGTVGVSENIIEASWRALVEAAEYALVVVAEQEPDRVGDTSSDLASQRPIVIC